MLFISDIYSGTGGGHWDILGHTKYSINANLMDKREKEREGEIQTLGLSHSNPHLAPRILELNAKLMPS